jgi:hypothetical protein
MDINCSLNVDPLYSMPLVDPSSVMTSVMYSNGANAPLSVPAPAPGASVVLTKGMSFAPALPETVQCDNCKLPAPSDQALVLVHRDNFKHVIALCAECAPDFLTDNDMSAWIDMTSWLDERLQAERDARTRKVLYGG